MKLTFPPADLNGQFLTPSYPHCSPGLIQTDGDNN